MTPTETRLFLLELRSGRPSALRRLKAALVAAGGNVSDAAVALGIQRARVYSVAEAQPKVRAIVDKHGMGRDGAAGRALAARKAAS